MLVLKTAVTFVFGIVIWAQPVAAHFTCNQKQLQSDAADLLRGMNLPTNSLVVLGPDLIEVMVKDYDITASLNDDGDQLIDIYTMTGDGPVMISIAGAATTNYMRSFISEMNDDTSRVVVTSRAVFGIQTMDETVPCLTENYIFFEQSADYFALGGRDENSPLMLSQNGIYELLLSPPKSIAKLSTQANLEMDLTADPNVTKKIDGAIAGKNDLTKRVQITNVHYGRADTKVTIPRDDYDAAKALNDANPLFYSSDFQVNQTGEPYRSYMELSLGVVKSANQSKTTVGLSGGFASPWRYDVVLNFQNATPALETATMGYRFKLDDRRYVFADFGQLAQDARGLRISGYDFDAGLKNITGLHVQLTENSDCDSCRSTQIAFEKLRYFDQYDAYIGMTLKTPQQASSRRLENGFSYARSLTNGIWIEAETKIDFKNPRTSQLQLRLDFPISHTNGIGSVPLYINGHISSQNDANDPQWNGWKNKRDLTQNSLRAVMGDWRNYMRWSH